jgi:hypothetical protein
MAPPSLFKQLTQIFADILTGGPRGEVGTSRQDAILKYGRFAPTRFWREIGPTGNKDSCYDPTGKNQENRLH